MNLMSIRSRCKGRVLLLYLGIYDQKDNYNNFSFCKVSTDRYYKQLLFLQSMNILLGTKSNHIALVENTYHFSSRLLTICYNIFHLGNLHKLLDLLRYIFLVYT